MQFVRTAEVGAHPLPAVTFCNKLNMYEHENEKLVVLLASNGSIADPEHKDEFKRSVNDWDEVLRAFGSAAEPAVAVADAVEAGRGAQDGVAPLAHAHTPSELLRLIFAAGPTKPAAQEKVEAVPPAVGGDGLATVFA